MNSIIANVTPRALAEADLDLIVIGNGSYKMLDGYRSMYCCPSLRTTLTISQISHSSSRSGCTPTLHSPSTEPWA